MGNRVLILSASAGTGHLRCGEALEEAFAADPRVGRVVHRDALRLGARWLRGVYSGLYARMARSAPELLGLAYRASDAPWRAGQLRLGLERMGAGPLMRWIRAEAPDLVVCTHFLPAGVVDWMLGAGRLRTHLAVVVTDLDCHALWLVRRVGHYCVALEETRAHLEAVGVDGDRIHVTGIPVAARFRDPVDREAVCARAGLDPARPILLVSAGALGMGPTEELVRRLLRVRLGAQMVVVCGRCPELRGRVESLVGGSPGVCVRGYTRRMHEWMRISALFVGKPGGLTTAEALVCGLPMAVVAPIPGQEERNSDHLLEEGVAIRCNELTTAGFKIARLLADPGRLEAMALRAVRLAMPAAAETVAGRLLDAVGGGHPGLERACRGAIRRGGDGFGEALDCSPLKPRPEGAWRAGHEGGGA